MTAHEKLSAAIRAANDAGRTALVPFITAGYPEPKDWEFRFQTRWRMA